jgi:hypothetical protein
VDQREVVARHDVLRRVFDPERPVAAGFDGHRCASI